MALLCGLRERAVGYRRSESDDCDYCDSDDHAHDLEQRLHESLLARSTQAPHVRRDGTVSAKSLLEPRVVAYGGEIVVSARVLAEPREQLDGAPEVAERLVAGVARERREAGVVVMEARMIRHVLEATAYRLERVGVTLLAVGG